MIARARLLFDENFGKPLIAALKQLAIVCREPTEISHILDFYLEGEAPDDIWIPRLQEDWIIISADRARRCGGPKLPELCKAFGRTHVLLSKTLHHMKQFQKTRAIIGVWPELLKLANVPRGSCYSLRKAGSSGNTILVLRSVGTSPSKPI